MAKTSKEERIAVLRQTIFDKAVANFPTCSALSAWRLADGAARHRVNEADRLEGVLIEVQLEDGPFGLGARFTLERDGAVTLNGQPLRLDDVRRLQRWCSAVLDNH